MWRLGFTLAMRIGLVSLVALVSLVSLVSPAYGDAGDALYESLEDEKNEKARRFRALVSKGDRERAAGRRRTAALAYQEALAVRPDPLIAGRFGVLLVELGMPEKAPEYLIDAIQRAADASKEERKQFFEAHEVARGLGAWIEVIISHAGTQVTLDGRPTNQVGRSAFWTFVLAGKHEVRAKLDGYEETVVTFTAQKRKDMPVRINLRPLSEETVRAPATLVRKKEATPKPTMAKVIMNDEPVSKYEDPYNYEDPQREEEKQGARGSIGAGPIMVFGVASWSPAVGVVIAGRLRLKEVLSVGVEGRAAWLTTGVAGRQITALTAGGLLTACAHWRWLFGCGVGHLGVINVNFSDYNFTGRSYVNVKPGAGARIGVGGNVTPSFRLQGAAEILGLTSGVTVVVGQTVLVEQPPLMVSTQITGAWEF